MRPSRSWGVNNGKTEPRHQVRGSRDGQGRRVDVTGGPRGRLRQEGAIQLFTPVSGRSRALTSRRCAAVLCATVSDAAACWYRRGGLKRPSAWRVKGCGGGRFGSVLHLTILVRETFTHRVVHLTTGAMPSKCAWERPRPCRRSPEDFRSGSGEHGSLRRRPRVARPSQGPN